MALPGQGGLTAAERNQRIDRERREQQRGEGPRLTKYQKMLQQQGAQAATNRPVQITRPSQPVPGPPVGAPVAAAPILPTPTVAAAPTQTTKPMQPMPGGPGVPAQPQVMPPAAMPAALGPAMPAADLAPPAADNRLGAAQLSANKQKQALSGGGFKPQYV